MSRDKKLVSQMKARLFALRFNELLGGLVATLGDDRHHSVRETLPGL